MLKKINVKEYNHLFVNEKVVVETMTVREGGGKVTLSFEGPERGTLIHASSREKEIKKDDKWTGKFETVADTVVYVPEDQPDVIRTVIGCGMFRLFKEVSENDKE